MIKFTAPIKTGGTLLGLGLSKKNIEKLMQGLPIKINGSDINLPNIEVFIMYGETEQKMHEDMVKMGLVTGGTKVKGLPDDNATVN